MAAKSYAWKLCSEYNRRKSADAWGLVVCVSCGKTWHWSECDAGHFLPRTKGKALFWLPDNIHPQCRFCNRNTNQEMIKINYAMWMVEKYGKDKVDLLRQTAKTTYHESQLDIDHWAGFYKAELKKLEAKCES